MIRMINDGKRLSMYDADNRYRDCNYIMMNLFREKGEVNGVIYAVSDSPDTQGELVDMERELYGQGIDTLIGGEYRGSIDISDMRMVRMA